MEKIAKEGEQETPENTRSFWCEEHFLESSFFCLFLVGGAGQIGKVYFFNPISSESCSTVIHCSPTVPQPQIFLFELFVYQIKLPLLPQPHFWWPFSSMESAQCLLLQLVSPLVPQLQSKYFQYLCVFHVSSIQLFSDLPFKNKWDPWDNYRSPVCDQWKVHSVQGNRNPYCSLLRFLIVYYYYYN